MTASIISIVCNAIQIVCWIVATILYGLQKRWINQIELIVAGHISKLYELKRLVTKLQEEVTALNMRLDELDPQNTRTTL